MNPEKWIDLVVSISLSTASVLLIRLYIKTRSILELYFSLAAITVALPYFLDLFNIDVPFNSFEWGKLVSITIYISGLLVLIRDSKPVFARFPKYLTAMPFVSFLFFPYVVDTIIIKDLLNAIYQGGALAVTVLVFTLNQARKKGRRYYIAGIMLTAAAYLSYWLYFNRNLDVDWVWISELLFSAGIIITTLRFVSGSEHHRQ